MSALDCEVVVTRLGAIAVRDRVSGETMHPMGPSVEAREVYVGPSRLEARLREGGAPLLVLDVGLGAASNAIAAWRVSEALPETARRLEIVSFEHDLGALRLALEPAHAEAFGFSNRASPEHRAANAIARYGAYETPRTSWRLSFGDFLPALAKEPASSADIVFWDMFSRGVNPELWTASTFAALRRVCREGATVHTYNAATSTRSAMLLGGFAVGVGGGTGDRSQTTIAAVNHRDLTLPLDARWLKRLERSSAPFPPDVENDTEARVAALARIRSQPQFSAI
ncbi:MAG: MnmC family methyltransferase [Polyangiaceae bacterium]|nr:MnmC family methyltransferase [Polyangiaceae bacterium]